jgi:hypothetical protein
LQNFLFKSTSYWQPFLTPTALANREVNMISWPNAMTGSPESELFSACISVSKTDPNDENETGSRGVVCLRQNQAPFFFLNIKIASKFAKFASKS